MEAARAMSRGARRELPGARTVLRPVSDGGDGLIEAMRAARGGRLVNTRVHGPNGERRRSYYARIDADTAVIEMARASGLALLKGRLDPLGCSTRGTGELVLAAARAGARTILVGMGGSASSDGGAGLAQALGAGLLDKYGRPIGPGASGLLELERVEAAEALRFARPLKVIALSDVDTPLTGPRGSARVFGPQKGADPAQVRLIGRALSRYARIVKRDLGRDVAELPGGGAAGGLGAGLAAFLGATIVRGAAWILDSLGFDAELARADLVLTGEGRFDRTSLRGKAPVEVLRRARAAGVPAALVCGSLEPVPGLKALGAAALEGCVAPGARPPLTRGAAAGLLSGAAARAVRAALLAAAAFGVFPGTGSAALAAENPLGVVDSLYFYRHQPGNLEESIKRLEELVVARPGEGDHLWRLGRSLVRFGERQDSKKDKLKAFERAEELCRKAVELKPQDADAHFWLGLAMGKRGQTRGILKSLFLLGPLRREMEAVIKLDPKHGGAYHVLGEMDMQVPGFAGGSKKRAVKNLEKALDLTPNYTAHHPALAEAYMEVGDKEKAIAVLKRAFTVTAPEDPGEFDDNLKDARELLKKLEN